MHGVRVGHPLRELLHLLVSEVDVVAHGNARQPDVARWVADEATVANSVFEHEREHPMDLDDSGCGARCGEFADPRLDRCV
jgi:hypothetical protein